MSGSRQPIRAAAPRVTPNAPSRADVTNPLLLTARRRFAEICARDSAFGHLPLFVEPSWQIMLHAFMAQLRNGHTTRDAVLRLFPRLSSQTVDRYVRVMVDEGLLASTAGAADAAVQITLTIRAVDLMSEALSPRRAERPVHSG